MRTNASRGIEEYFYMYCLSCFEACILAGHFLVAHLVLKGALENLITFAAKWLHHFAIVSRLDFGTCRKVCWFPSR